MTDLVQAKPDIALMGPARSGKDSVADYLVATYGYTKLGFADPVKDVALAMDPVIPGMIWTDDTPYRLSDAVDELGWERAKDEVPEVRRLLVGLGHGMRQKDEDVWLRLMMGRVEDLRSAGSPVVVSGTRYANEYHTLSTSGFQMVRLHRADAQAAGVDPDHASETEISHYHAHVDIHNDGSLDDLYAQLDWHAGR